MIKLFIWNNFIERYFKDWLDEYAGEQHMIYEEEHEDMRNDLD
jgi:hypothetical protein|tara:strand:+ start:1198 stop:1326 length:129 start_codon:yes stop_codon:yes gene_type:complete